MAQGFSAPTGIFQGLDERQPFGGSLEKTTSLDNVIVRNGRVKGRKGLALWDGISAVPTNQIIGLWDFYAPSSATSSLVRMTTTTFEVWNSSTHAWDDKTGTALSGDTSTRVSFANLSDQGYMVFTNEGHNQPRKWTGSGNTATLGGTPPYAKWLAPYVGFLFLLNTSLDGTFSAVADSITAYFSDQPDTSWDICDANTIIYNETPGEIRAAHVFGDNLIVFKADGIVQTRFTGGATRFARKLIPFGKGLGILAPLTLQRLGEFGLIFLATDRNLYLTDGYSVRPLPLNIQKSLQETMSVAKAPYASGYVDVDHETYHLLYSRNSSTYFDGRLSFNYRTGEFYRGAYTGYEFLRAHAFRQSNVSATQLVVAANDKKIYEQESGTDDASTSVKRYYDLDWYQYGMSGSKLFTGANLVFTHATNVQVRVSVAVDHSPKFQYARMFSLKSKVQSNGSFQDNTRVRYEIPSPIYGSWFKLRVEFFHYGSTNVVEMQECEPVFIPVHRTVEDQSKQIPAQRA